MKNTIAALVVTLAFAMSSGAAPSDIPVDTFTNSVDTSQTNNVTGDGHHHHGNNNNNNNGNGNGGGHHHGNTAGTQSGNNQTDNRWLDQAAAGSLHEIAAGNLAQTNSSSADVQAFGASLVQDHTTAYQQASDLAASKGNSVPTEETSAQLRDDQILAGLTGTDFDKTFLDQMIRGHLRDIQSYSLEAQNGHDADTRAFAEAQLPILMKQLLTALSLEESLGLTGSHSAHTRTPGLFR